MTETRGMDGGGKRFLHVGCGVSQRLPWVFAGWREVRLDIDPQVRPDILASMTDMSAVADASMDAVYSAHNLEHLEAHQVPVALREFRRVVRPEGWVLLIVPDLQSVAALVAQDRLEDAAYEAPGGPIAPIDIIFGHRRSIAAGNVHMAHRTGFTATTLAAAISAGGFENAVIQRHFYSLWAFAVPTAAALQALPHRSPAAACRPDGP